MKTSKADLQKPDPLKIYNKLTWVSGLSKGRGQGREDGKKGLTQTSLLDHIVHPDSGRCADWIIYKAPWRHTTGIKNFITAYSVNWSRWERKLARYWFLCDHGKRQLQTTLEVALQLFPGIKRKRENRNCASKACLSNEKTSSSGFCRLWISDWLFHLPALSICQKMELCLLRVFVELLQLHFHKCCSPLESLQLGDR